MSKADIKEKARLLYVESGFAIPTIKRIMGDEVSKKSLYNWFHTDKWEQQRKLKKQYIENLDDKMYEMLLLAFDNVLESNANAKAFLSAKRSLEIYEKFEKLRGKVPGTTDTSKTKKSAAEVKAQISELLGMK